MSSYCSEKYYKRVGKKKKEQKCLYCKKPTNKILQFCSYKCYSSYNNIHETIQMLTKKYLRGKINIYEAYIGLIKEPDGIVAEAIKDLLHKCYGYKSIPLFKVLQYIDSTLSDKEAKDVATDLYSANTKLFSDIDYKKATILISEHSDFKHFLRMIRS